MEECGEESIKNEFYTCVKLPITNLIISLKMITDINVRSKTEVIRNRECLKLWNGNELLLDEILIQCRK